MAVNSKIKIEKKNDEKSSHPKIGLGHVAYRLFVFSSKIGQQQTITTVISVVLS